MTSVDEKLLVHYRNEVIELEALKQLVESNFIIKRTEWIFKIEKRIKKVTKLIGGFEKAIERSERNE